MSALIEYPFVVREGIVAKIRVPGDLTKQEAAKLIKFLYTLAVDFEPPTEEGKREKT